MVKISDRVNSVFSRGSISNRLEGEIFREKLFPRTSRKLYIASPSYFDTFALRGKAQKFVPEHRANKLLGSRDEVCVRATKSVLLTDRPRKLRNPLHPPLDRPHIRRIGRPHMVIRTKGNSWNQGHMMIRQQPIAKLQGA
jgi:hypothetical protein